jgi:adenine deaminase
MGPCLAQCGAGDRPSRRGAIAPGLRADLVLIDDSDRTLPVVRASIVAGELRFASTALPPAWHA